MSTLELTKTLIACPSVTPDDAGCQTLIAERLKKSGFQIEHLPSENVQNLFATRGTKPPLLVFVGHTDVVPPGDLAAWTHPPFQPTILGDHLFGRGAADMKGGVAAMITACEHFFAKHPNPHYSIGILLTSDEEGPALHGIHYVAEVLKQRGTQIDYAIVGEPSSVEKLGDTIKVGRRGSLTGSLTLHGIQGHVAYPEKALNPIHSALPILSALEAHPWDDERSPEFPATSFQISNIHAGTGASNVIPPHIKIDFNLRFAPPLSADQLKRKIQTLIHDFGINHDLEFAKVSHPFITQPGSLRTAVEHAIFETLHLKPESSTNGGTSDGRFIAAMGAEVIELGVINATIHKVNECVRIEDLEKLSLTYLQILEKLEEDAKMGRLTYTESQLN